MQGFAQRSGSSYANYWQSYLNGWHQFHACRLTEAVESFSTAVEMQYIGYATVIIDAYAGLALSQQLLGRWEKANELVGKMLDFAGTMDDAHCLAMAQSSQARIKLLQGDLSAALLWAQSLVMEPDLGSLFFWLENPWINKSRILLAEGSENNLEKAAQLLYELQEISENGKFICQQRDINILQALVLVKQGKSAEALELLKEELAISGQEGWRSHFLEAEALLDDLLHALHDKDSSNEFLQAIMEERTISRSKLTASTKSASSLESLHSSDLTNKLTVILTRRELEVMKLMAKGLRNKEIAFRNNISEDTVKKHIYNIYQKFGVNKRMDLLKMATNQGYISESD